MTHQDLVDRAVAWLRSRWGCRYVLAEPGSVPERPDAIGWGRNDGIVVECKTSLSDFYADRRKPWRRGRGLGAYRWYLTPAGLLTADRLPAFWGLAECHPRQIRIVRRAREVPVGWRDVRREVQLLAARAARERTLRLEVVMAAVEHQVGNGG